VREPVAPASRPAQRLFGVGARLARHAREVFTVRSVRPGSICDEPGWSKVMDRRFIILDDIYIYCVPLIFYIILFPFCWSSTWMLDVEHTSPWISSHCPYSSIRDSDSIRPPNHLIILFARLESKPIRVIVYYYHQDSLRRSDPSKPPVRHREAVLHEGALRCSTLLLHHHCPP
jgi:hypothetical protein